MPDRANGNWYKRMQSGNLITLTGTFHKSVCLQTLFSSIHRISRHGSQRGNRPSSHSQGNHLIYHHSLLLNYITAAGLGKSYFYTYWGITNLEISLVCIWIPPYAILGDRSHMEIKTQFHHHSVLDQSILFHAYLGSGRGLQYSYHLRYRKAMKC